ncbi:DUF6290 family protein [Amygdalobacter nucleatus]|uniref:DUF6290 family protein n=1 Tax=Amygdalobacter nucleatus TaxID=3029274 RepID=UPI0036F20B26
MAIKSYSALNNISVSEAVLSSILEKIENEEDYKLALEASKSPLCAASVADLAKECNIDYEKL